MHRLRVPDQIESETMTLRRSTSALPSRRLLLAGLASLPLAGCLTRQGGGYTARAGAETLASEPILHVATTRRFARDLTRSPFLETSRSPALSYARAYLRAPDTSALGKINALVTNDFAVQRVEPAGAGAAATQLSESLRGKDSLLYVHGYNQTFESAALEAAQLSDGIGFKGNSVLFSWPSKGGLLDYGYDRESALLARDPFSDALSAILQDDFGAKLHLVAHSMGTLVTLETIRSYRDRHGDKGLERVGALVLASPDIDADLFKASVARLGPWRDKILVITATNDRALDLSRRLAGGDRVGALPPEALAGTGIKAIDATEFASGIVRHDAFLSNADVRAVIRRAVERA
jgi:esterase/lipase superfamily enzyme